MFEPTPDQIGTYEFTLYQWDTRNRLTSVVAKMDSDRETYSLTEDIQAQLKNIHGTIRAYTWYVIGAFKNLSGAKVEEINLKFGMKIGGKAGLPIFTEGTAESNFEVSVKCKFPSQE